MGRYLVVGGQYRRHEYGSTDDLRSAKDMAESHDELWDNWQGWHMPVVEDSVGGTIHYFNRRTDRWDSEPMVEW